MSLELDYWAELGKVAREKWLFHAAVRAAVAAGEGVMEVEAAGNTPLHSAAYEGWLEGAALLIELGAKVDASNNAGDRPWHWAHNLGHMAMLDLLEKVRCRSICLSELHIRTGRAAMRPI